MGKTSDAHNNNNNNNNNNNKNNNNETDLSVRKVTYNHNGQVAILSRDRDYFLFYGVQTGSLVPPALCPMYNGGSVLCRKVNLQQTTDGGRTDI
jgi:hypothetical protein